MHWEEERETGLPNPHPMATSSCPSLTPLGLVPEEDLQLSHLVENTHIQLVVGPRGEKASPQLAQEGGRVPQGLPQVVLVLRKRGARSRTGCTPDLKRGVPGTHQRLPHEVAILLDVGKGLAEPAVLVLGATKGCGVGLRGSRGPRGCGREPGATRVPIEMYNMTCLHMIMQRFPRNCRTKRARTSEKLLSSAGVSAARHENSSSDTSFLCFENLCVSFSAGKSRQTHHFGQQLEDLSTAARQMLSPSLRLDQQEESGCAVYISTEATVEWTKRTSVTCACGSTCGRPSPFATRAFSTPFLYPCHSLRSHCRGRWLP